MQDPAHIKIETLLNQRPLLIEAMAGRTRALVVSFTSVGTQRHVMPPREFTSVASQGGENHVLFVTDMSRSWMNGVGLVQAMRVVINGYIDRHHITSVRAIGTSMGGFAAMVLSYLMPVERVVAFAPQYSVHPDVMPNENRWKFFRRQITDWPYRELDALPSEETDAYIFHGDTADEVMHWQRFPKGRNLRHFILIDGDHNFVAEIKKRGKLPALAGFALNGKPQRVKILFAKLGGVTRHQYETTHSIAG